MDLALDLHLGSAAESVGANGFSDSRVDPHQHIHGDQSGNDILQSNLLSADIVVERAGAAAYFLTVAEVVDLIRAMQVRVAARGYVLDFYFAPP